MRSNNTSRTVAMGLSLSFIFTAVFAAIFQLRLGLHEDRGEGSLAAPVVSLSLGDDATFVMGGLTRKDPTRRMLLHSGDVIAFGGRSRLIFHAVVHLIAHVQPAFGRRPL